MTEIPPETKKITKIPQKSKNYQHTPKPQKMTKIPQKSKK